jgi:hypothetical protein
MRIGTCKRIWRLGLAIGVAALALSLLWLMVAPRRQALATAPVTGDPVSTDGAVSILTAGDGVTTAVTADLDNDGQVDLAFNDGSDVRIVANGSTTAAVSWAPSATVMSMGAPVADLTAADFDRDGLVDLAVATSDGSGFSELRLLRNPASPFVTSWSQSQPLTSSAQLSLSTVVAADLDGDGAPDLVSAGGDGVIRLWHNPMTDTQNFATAWGSPVEITTGDGEISQVVLADVDRDGWLDIVAISGGSTPRVRIWQSPALPFSSAWSTTNLVGDLSADGLSLAVADLDLDGVPDVVAGTAGGSVLVWRNPLTGTQPFGTSWGAVVTVESGTGPVEVLQTADMDHDGYVELIRGTSGTSASLAIWHSQGAPFAGDWFSHAVGAPGRAIHALAVADLDPDGDADIVSGDSGALLHWPNALIHRNAPLGNRTSVGLMGSIEGAAVGDLDRDGRPDLVTVSYGGATRLWRNNGTPFGSGWPSISWNYDNQIRSLALADLDGDGYLDLVTGHAYGTSLRVWQNDGTPFDGSWEGWPIGSVPNDDFANTWPKALAAGDVDGDGAVDIVVGAGSDFGSGITDPVTRSTDFGLYAWYHGGNPFSSAGWSASTISVTLDAIYAVGVGDLDNDGRLDIVAGTNHAPSVGTPADPMTASWIDAYELRAFRNDGTPFDGNWPDVNVGRDPGTYTFDYENAPYHGYHGARVFAVALADLDNDGDLDIASGEGWEADYQVKAWENDGAPFDGDLWDFTAVGLGSQWPGQPYPWLDEAGTKSLASADINRDGLVDLVSGHEFGGVIQWENSGRPFGAFPTDTHWIRHSVGNIARSVVGMAAADFDRDGDPDLAATARASDQPATVYAWQNRGGGVSEIAADTAPVEISENVQDDLLRVAVSHNGKWVDHDVDLAWWRLALANGSGVPLTSAQAADLLEGIRVYRDGGDGVWQGAPDDTLVAGLTSLSLDSSGQLTITFPSGETLSAGDQEIYFVVATLQPDASLQEPSAFQVTFDPDAASLVTDQTTGSSVFIADTDLITGGPISITAGPPATVALEAWPTAITADGSSTAVITATVTNVMDHPVDDGTSVAFTTTLGSISLSALTTDGVATALLTSSTNLGTAVITVTAGSVSSNTSVQFVPGAPDEVVVTASAGSIVADGVSTAVVTATVTDALDRPVADGTSVAFATTLGSISPSALTTGGVATATLTSSASLGTADITATAGGVPGGTSVQFVLGPPDEVVVTPSPGSIIADGISTATLTAMVADVQGRPVEDGTNVAFATTLGSIAPSALTASGVATAILTSSTDLGTALVTATAGSALGNASVHFVAGGPYAVVVEALPGTIVADGVSTAIVTATVTDAMDRPVEDGTSVAFATTLGSVSPSALTAGGVATALLTSSTDLGTAVITATAGAVANDTSVQFVPGPLARLELIADPDSILADSSSTSVITATAVDAQGHLVGSEALVNFATTLGSVAPPARFTTGAVATATLTSSTEVGTAIVTATAGSVANSVLVDFIPGPPTNVAVTAVPGAIVADGSSTAVVTATVTDAWDRPVADGTNVAFTSSLGSIPPSALTTDGVATAILSSSTDLGTAVITAVAGTASDQGSVLFVIGPFAQIVVDAYPSTLVADGTSTAVITATLADAGGHIVTETRTVSFTTTLGVVYPVTRTTSSGIATATLQVSDTVGMATVTSWADGISGQTNVRFRPETSYIYLPAVVRNAGGGLN